MFNLKIKNPENLTKEDIKYIWSFIVSDIGNEFGTWVENNYYKLSEILDIDLCCDLLDIKKSKKLSGFRELCFNLIKPIKLDCYCAILPSNTLLYRFAAGKYSELNNFIDSLKIINVLNELSGTPPVSSYRRFHQTTTCYCQICNQHYIKLYEESDCDYYLIKQARGEVIKSTNDPMSINKAYKIATACWNSINMHMIIEKKLGFIRWECLFHEINTPSNQEKKFMEHFKYHS